MVGTADLLLVVSQLDGRASMLSVQPARQQKRKIHNIAGLLETWNIYIRIMTHFHPQLIPDQLVYQDFYVHIATVLSYPVLVET